LTTIQEDFNKLQV